MFARRERLCSFPAEVFQSEQVVGEDRFALEQVKTIAPETASERVKHSLGAFRRNFHVSGDRVGLVEYVRCVAAGHAGYFARVGELGAAGHVAWAAAQGRARGLNYPAEAPDISLPRP